MSTPCEEANWNNWNMVDVKRSPKSRWAVRKNSDDSPEYADGPGDEGCQSRRQSQEGGASVLDVSLSHSIDINIQVIESHKYLSAEYLSWFNVQSTTVG